MFILLTAPHTADMARVFLWWWWWTWFLDESGPGADPVSIPESRSDPEEDEEASSEMPVFKKREGINQMCWGTYSCRGCLLHLLQQLSEQKTDTVFKYVELQKKICG